MKFNKQTYLKKQLLYYLISVISTFIALLVVVYFSFQHYKLNTSIKKVLVYKTETLKEHITNYSSITQNIKNAKKFKLYLNQQESEATGLKLDQAKEFLINLTNHYRILPSSNIFAGKQQKFGFFQSTNKNLVGSQIFMNLYSESDTEIFRFLDTLTKQFPGLLKVGYIRVRKQYDLKKDIIKDLSEGISRNIVKAEIGIEWYDFLSNEKSDK
jgi:hypothetical protein